MMIFLLRDGERWPVESPGDNVPSALVPDKLCPKCKSAPFRISLLSR